jgi:hypothetical protein
MPCIAKVLFGIHAMWSLSTRRFLKVKRNLELGDFYGDNLSNFHNKFKTLTKICLCTSISILFANQIYSYPTYNPIHHDID